MYKITLLLFVSIIFFSCQSRKDKLRELAIKFNNDKTYLYDPNIKSLNAFTVGDSQINIRISLNIVKDPTDEITMDAILPQMGKLILTGRTIQNLLDDGANFRIILQDKNDVEIANKLFNKEALNTIDKVDVSNSFDQRNNSNNQDLNLILSTMNKVMPIIDKESGTEIYKVNISQQNELVYWVKVDKDLEDLLQIESIAAMMKEDICANSDLRNVFSTFRKYNVFKIKYNYCDAKEQIITSIAIKQSDLK